MLINKNWAAKIRHCEGRNKKKNATPLFNEMASKTTGN